MEMTKYKLGDLCRIASSKRIFESEYVDQGIPFIRGQEISDGSILDPKASFECYISQDRYEEIKEKYGKPSKGDILITAVGTIGNLCYLDKDIDFYFKDGNVIWFSEIIPSCEGNFLFHFMKSSFFKAQLKYFMIGAVQKALTIDMLKKVEVPLPPLSEQKKIASVLSALDDKIALNKKMNQKLEAMAKRLYDYWFVQYDFPDKNGHPYKTTGGKMEYNPTLKREIPAGWEVNVVGDVCETVLGGTPSTENESYWNGNIPWLNSGEVAEFPILNAEKRITEDAVKNSATAYLPAGSVTLSITRHLRPSIMAIDACINQSVAGIKENGILKNGYLYPYLVNEIPRLNTLRGGAQQPHINKDTVDKSPIVIPAQNVLHQYYEKVNPLYREIIEKAKESQKLTTLRDKLLPLLMNGQVVVG